MFKKLIGNSRLPLKICAATVCSAIAFKNFVYSHEHVTLHSAAGYNYCRKFYPASSEYPDIGKHRNIMARNLTKSVYAKLRDLRTSNGFNIDDAIQTGSYLFNIHGNTIQLKFSFILGVDNIGNYSFTGIVAGDEESYNVTY